MPALLDLDVHSLAHDGRAVCRDGGRVIFIRGGLPGQRVRARLTRETPRFAEGSCEVVLRPAPDEVPAPCPHAAVCGGCPLQQMPADRQLFWKARILEDALIRIGNVRVPPDPVVPSPRLWGYRNKMEFAFAPDAARGLRLGLRVAASHAVEDIRSCLLMPPGAMETLDVLRRLARETGLPAWSTTRGGRGAGFWRFAVLRMPETPGPDGRPQFLCLCVTSPAGSRERAVVAAVGRTALQRAPLLTGFVHQERAANDLLAQGERTALRLGETTLHERLGGLAFAVDCGGFFQVNTLAAEALCAAVEDAAALRGRETLWDLYCGVGAPGLILARRLSEGGSLWGMEYAPDAVEMARRNAAGAGFVHCRYEAGDARRIPRSWPRPHAVLADPPRAGLHGDVVRALLRRGPAKIIYVSCNPATLARDARLLAPGYDVVRVTPVDLFPQTPHVESVTLLERRPSFGHAQKQAVSKHETPTAEDSP